MKSIRQSSLAVLLVLVSTAAFGPGARLAEAPAAVGDRLSQPLAQGGALLTGLQAFMPSAQPAGTLAAVLADERLEETDFLAVDFMQAPEIDAVYPAGGPAFFTGLTGGENARTEYRPGNGPGAGAGLGSAPTAIARAPGQNAQLAGNGGKPGSTGSALSGFRADPASADSSAIALDDPALRDRDIGQLPLLALAPTPADIDAGGRVGVGADETTNAVPEPTTAFLLGIGLMGLLGARLRRREPAQPT